MNIEQIEKYLKALEKSPTPSIAIKRHIRLTKFITQNTRSGSDLRGQFRERCFESLKIALDSLDPFSPAFRGIKS